jgi:hypothetical protein
MLNKSKSKPELEPEHYVELDLEHWPDQRFKELLKQWHVSMIVLSKLGPAGRSECRLYGTESRLEGLLQEPYCQAHSSLVGQIRSVGAV